MKRFERILGLALALALCAPLSTARAAFTDVPEGHWAEESVEQAVDLGLVQGLGNHIFGLGRAVTRAQYMALLCRLMGWEMIVPEQGSFADNQDTSAWYYSAVETAKAHGVFTEQDELCLPADPVTREELAALTVRALGWGSLAGLVQDDCRFTDVTINRGYVALAYRMGFLFGVGNGKFDPKAVCSREQAAAVLLRLRERMNGTVERGSKLPDGVVTIAVPTLLGQESPIPFSPRAAMEEVYAAAVKVGPGGTVILHTAPFLQTVKNGRPSQGTTITAEDMAELLKTEGTESGRSSRYGSSYALCPTEEQNVSKAIWFESPEDLEEKIELCRLLGIKAVYFVD